MIYVRNKLVFFHVPKTGGSWFIFNMVKNCTDDVFYGSDFHWTRDMFVGKDHWLDIRGLKSIAFVRNPITWYLSFWKHQNSKGWHTNYGVSWFNFLSSDCQHSDFEEFLKLVLEKHPGFVTRFYQAYLGQDFSGVNYIIKQENLLDGCCKILKRRAVQFNEKDFRAFPKNNVTTIKGVPYSKELKIRVAETESKVMKAFNYKGGV